MASSTWVILAWANFFQRGPTGRYHRMRREDFDFGEREVHSVAKRIRRTRSKASAG